MRPTVHHKYVRQSIIDKVLVIALNQELSHLTAMADFRQEDAVWSLCEGQLA